MSPDPTGYSGEVGLDGTSVEKIAGSVAARQGTRGSIVMRLDLEHSYAVIELINDSQLLVGGCIVGHGEGAVMGSNVCDVAVFSTAELGIVVACLRIGWKS